VFTGIVEHLGRIRAVEPDPRGGARLLVFAPTVAAQSPEPKDSICVNGVCLTLVKREGDDLAFDVVPETLRRSNLAALRVGDMANLELSLRLGDRLGGHLVYGHIDATAAILARSPEGQGFRVTVERPADLARYIVAKGSVALEGVSLTVASAGDGRFEIAVIPETATRTTLGTKVAGSRLNLEIDPIARYALAAFDAYETVDAVREDELAWAYEI
jgi:riboflavin synthase